MNSQATETKNFNNENVSVEAIVAPGCHVQLNVTVHPKLVTKSHQEALHRVRKEVSLPGFRKGKAPDSLIITHYSKAIDGEWRDILLNNAFQEAMTLSSFAPVKASAKSIKSQIKELKSPKEEAVLSYEFESLPETPSIDIAKLHVNKPAPTEVTEDYIDKKIEEIRVSFATWEDVQGRPVQENDFVRLDISEIKDGQEQPDFTNERFQVTSVKMAPWLKSLVIGLNIGDSKEGMSSPDEAFLREEDRAAFKPSLFKVTVNSIENAILPELGEDFAKRLGVSTMDEVRSAIRRQLENAAYNEAVQKQQKELEDLLAETYSFELPKSLLEHDAQMLTSQERQNLSRKNLSKEEYELKSAQIEEKARSETKRRLTLYYLLRKYNAEHKINVSNEDLNLELNKILQQFPKEMLPQIAKSLNDEIYAAILSEVVVRKGLEHLVQNLHA